MPVSVCIKGLPEGNELEALCEDFIQALLGMRELGLERNQIVVWFDKDHMEEGLGKEFSILVTGLEVRNNKHDPEAPFSIRNMVAAALGAVIVDKFSQIDFLDVKVAPFGPDWGHFFYRSPKETL